MRNVPLSRYAKVLLRQCPTDQWEQMPGNIRPGNPTLKTLTRRNLIQTRYVFIEKRWTWKQVEMTVEEATIALLDVLPNTPRVMDTHPACEEIKRLRRLMEIK